MSNVQSRRVCRIGLGNRRRAGAAQDGRRPLYRDALIWFGVSLLGWAVISFGVLAGLGAI